jgi:predicted kinase
MTQPISNLESSIANYQLPITRPPTAYVLIGAQGSGKSTWACANAERLGAVVVASDDIRNELEARGLEAAERGDEVFAILETRVDALLAQGRSVVVDATHARRTWRANVLALARAHGAHAVAVWFDLPLEAALAGNARKRGSVWGQRPAPRAFLTDVWRGLEPPGEGEFDEVWKMTGEAA